MNGCRCPVAGCPLLPAFSLKCQPRWSRPRYIRMGPAWAPNERGLDMVARTSIVPLEGIESQIFLLRGYKVMLSPHLADLYQVEPRVLVQAINRISLPFPKL